MALSLQLAEQGLVAQSITTKATVTIEKTDAGFTITSSHLELTARIPGASQQAFEKATDNAKDGCPVSKVLDTKITLDRKLEA
jgi:osmotically inducible protein OsmC